MMLYSETLQIFRDFIDAGGPVIYVIVLLGFFLWLLIIERYWFILKEHPKQLQDGVHAWIQHRAKNSWRQLQTKKESISVLTLALRQHLSTIKTLIALCPLLGLLGTVTGMISVFDTLALTGTGNARAMADGISQATLPTLAGMVVALSGLYFSADLERRTRNASNRIQEHYHKAAQR